MATNTSTVNVGTQRTDAWWTTPALAALALLAFTVYAVWAALQNAYFTVPGTQYISPFYAPYLPEILHFLKIEVPDFLRAATYTGWAISPAFFIIWAPLGFRGTCYFYRKVYYRSFFTAPVACSVELPVKSPLSKLLGSGRRYWGERGLPMVLNNLHRYFLYIAILLFLLHVWDMAMSLFLPGFKGLYLGVGTGVMLLDVVLLGGYIFGCHSYRHLIGGRVDCFSSCPMGDLRHEAWQRQSLLNEQHQFFGWASLFWVGFTDLYVRLVSMGIWQDFHLSWTWPQLLG